MNLKLIQQAAYKQLLRTRFSGLAPRLQDFTYHYVLIGASSNQIQSPVVFESRSLTKNIKKVN